MREIKFEGYSADEILNMSENDLKSFVFVGEPLVLLAGSARVLGEFRISGDILIVELAQIEGGGEGVLQSLWVLTEQYACKRKLKQVEWIVHAINCAKPNLKLKRVLEKKGFEIRNVNGVGKAYYFLNKI
ncbi:MAG: hypothetical protein N2645_08610 [Clostridia bacterium]|nr:hypothetical protein [Clostridia bacterium]